MCSNDDQDCDSAETYLIGSLHFDENMMVFEVVNLPTDLDGRDLASDEEINYRILAKREGEGSWRKMNWYSSYENRKLGLSENMNLQVNDIIRLKPTVGYIEDYTKWILERVRVKAGVADPYGTGDRLLDIKVRYKELEPK